MLISINNKDERYIEFLFKGTRYKFDPNRMFTPTGRRESLQVFRTYSVDAAAEVKAFATELLRLIPDSVLLIAVHNNKEKEYSILNYLLYGEMKKEYLRIHYNTKMDADDFIFTTDSSLYYLYERADISAVQQHPRTATDDGSLSVLFGKLKRPYLNIEAQHGHLEEQMRMLSVILKRREQNHTGKKQ